jgi:hypothetical protein
MERIISSSVLKILSSILVVIILLLSIIDLFIAKGNLKIICISIFLVSICIFLLYASFTSRIRYTDTYMIIEICWVKSKVLYKDISSIAHSFYVGSYWINTYDGRHFHAALPMRKKEIKKMFDVALLVNPVIKVCI